MGIARLALRRAVLCMNNSFCLFPILEPYIRKLVCLGMHSCYGEQREAAGNYFFLHNK